MSSRADKASARNPLRELIESSLEDGKEKTVAIFPRKKFSINNRDLLRRVRQKMSQLEENPRPARVLLHLSKSPEYLEWLLACFASGVCVCPLDTGYGDAELQRAAAAFRPDWIVAHQPLPVVDPSNTRREDGITVQRLAQSSRKELPAGTALCLFTSGTTGQPKGVLLSAANLAYGAGLPPQSHGIGEDDRAMAILPLAMINGMVTTILGILKSRSSAVYYEGLFTAYQAMQWAIEHKATWINAVPIHYASFCNPLLAADEMAGHRLRFCRSAGSRLPLPVLEEFERHYKVPIIETMGLTEAAGQVFANPRSVNERKIGSVGRASGIDAKIVSADFKTLLDDEEGEIWIRGKNIFSGYLDDPDSTAQALKDGWLRTGDLGRRTADGFYFVTGRLKEIVIRGGQNVSLQEIDDTLAQHSAVAFAGSVGVDRGPEGEDVLSFVQLKSGRQCGEQELLTHCGERLAAFKLPSQIIFLEKLPLRSNAKVDKQQLKQMFQDLKESESRAQ